MAWLGIAYLVELVVLFLDELPDVDRRVLAAADDELVVPQNGRLYQT